MSRPTFVLTALFALTSITFVSPAVAFEPALSTVSRAPAPSPSQVARGRSDLETQTGLIMQITSVSPAGLQTDRPLRMSGTVTNLSSHAWTDAKVYLSIGSDPAVTKSALESFASDDDGFGTTINGLGLFDEIGGLRPGGRTDWHLDVPFDDLPISHAAGVYQVGATLLAGTAKGRDSLADARTATTISYVPNGASLSHRTHVVTLVPVTAPVLRHPDGVFVDDRLADLMSPAGRLRNLLDFAAQAPPGSLELVVDPALRQAAKDMSAGYGVLSIREQAEGAEVRAGAGQQDAAAWLEELSSLGADQHITWLPWSDPAVSSLATAGMRGVVNAAYRSSSGYGATSERPDSSVTDWQLNGSTTRRALAISRQAGARIHLVSQLSLPALKLDPSSGYPPPQVTVRTRPGPVTAVVTRADIGGHAFTRSLTSLQFRQCLLAEATVRALSGNFRPTSVFAAPFNWDPGNLSGEANLAAGYAYPTVAASSLGELSQRAAPPYSGGLRMVDSGPRLSFATLEAIRRLRHSGRVYSDLVTDHDAVAAAFDRQFASAGSAAWSVERTRGTAVTRELARQISEKIARVTVTGPAFVAMSSNSGRFPLTISNGLDVPVTVRVSVNPLNRALNITPLQPLHLAPGQLLDVDVKSTAEGTGLTQVRARLSTLSNRSFGRPLYFNIRATQIGVAIWIAMGIGVATLFISAGRRIYARARGPGFKTRGESSA
jgi:Family of unknown function (DUF6049)